MILLFNVFLRMLQLAKVLKYMYSSNTKKPQSLYLFTDLTKKYLKVCLELF